MTGMTEREDSTHGSENDKRKKHQFIYKVDFDGREAFLFKIQDYFISSSEKFKCG